MQAFEKQVISTVGPLCGSCETVEKRSTFPIDRKVLIWDMRNGWRSEAQKRLRKDLRASESDKSLIVFMIVHKREEQVGTYSVSGMPAYRQFIDLCVAIWPEQEAIGMFSIVSEKPRRSRPVSHFPEYGETNDPIANGVENLLWKNQLQIRRSMKTRN